MSTVRDKLIEDYAVHYNRMQAGQVDPRGMLPDRRGRYELEVGDLVDACPDGSKVLDLGCGTGNVLAYLDADKKHITPVGVDSSTSQIAIAQKFLPELEIHCTDGLEFLEANPGAFGGIICTDVFEHIPGKELLGRWVLSALEALQPGGFLFCRMPNGASIISGYCRYRDLTHECSFTSSSVLQLLESAGFIDCKIRPIRLPHFTGKARLFIEHWLHRAIFRICGEAGQEIYTSNICAVGYRGRD